jgi:hypothetical protein
MYVKQGDLHGVKVVMNVGRRAEPCYGGVRALIVARKRSNVRGAKGRRKVDA